MKLRPHKGGGISGLGRRFRPIPRYAEERAAPPHPQGVRYPPEEWEVKIFFLLNPSRQKRIWDYRQMASEIARRHGCFPRFGEIDRHDQKSTAHFLRQAVEEECPRVAVVGGDGTLHQAVNVLHQQKQLHKIELAVVPAGTCNDFARFLGLSRRRLGAAFRLACTGKAEAVDLGVMEKSGAPQELFINNAGVGRRLTTPRSARPLRTLGGFRPLPMRIRWEKGSIEGPFFMALVCNAPYFSGGLYASKNVRIDDGFLDVYVVPVMAKWKLVPLLLWGRLGRPIASRNLITLRIQKLALDAGTDLWPQSDGEPPAQAVRRVEFSLSSEKAMIVQ